MCYYRRRLNLVLFPTLKERTILESMRITKSLMCSARSNKSSESELSYTRCGGHSMRLRFILPPHQK